VLKVEQVQLVAMAQPVVLVEEDQEQQVLWR
jgi:hypothetical protein